MKQTAAFIFFCFLQYCHNNAFYKTITPISFCKRNGYLHSKQLNSQNNENNNDMEGFETDTISKKNPFRLGRTKDQDGKSNIWSVEPKMEVVEEEITELNKNIVTVGLIITGIIASLPVLYILNQQAQYVEY